MKDTIFREYDIRGIVGTELIIEQIYELAHAILYYCKRQKPSATKVLIARDGRISSESIFKQIYKAAIESGFDVIDGSLIPSPVLYFGMAQKVADIGLMITASHNPSEYNGIKIMIDTHAVHGSEIQEIKHYSDHKIKITSDRIGSIVNELYIKDAYITFLLNHFPTLYHMNLPVIFDCAHATAATIIPELSKRFGWSACTILFETIDGRFPAHEADPTVEKNMITLKKKVIETNAALGIGLDGDADRMAAITETGKLLVGDHLLAIFIRTIHSADRKKGIVINVTMSDGLAELCAQEKIPLIISPTGHAIIKKYMDEHQAILGGEGSCHFFFQDRYFGYDDGIYAALRLLEYMVVSKQKLSDLAKTLPYRCTSKEYRIPCDHDLKGKIMHHLKSFFAKNKSVTCLEIDGLRVTFPDGWAIVRPANTQPVLSMRFESKTVAGLSQIKTLYVELLKPFLSTAITVIWDT